MVQPLAQPFNVLLVPLHLPLRNVAGRAQACGRDGVRPQGGAAR